MGSRCEEPGHVAFVVVVVVKCERLCIRKAVGARTKMAQETLCLPQDCLGEGASVGGVLLIWGLNIIMPIVSPLRQYATMINQVTPYKAHSPVPV